MSAEPTDDVDVTHNTTEQRYEIHSDGRIVGVTMYRQFGLRIRFMHSEIAPDAQGRGFGGRLARAALDDAHRRGLAISVECPFIASYVARHPEYAALVDGAA